MKEEPTGICVSCTTKCAIAESEFNAMAYKYPEIVSCEDYNTIKRTSINNKENKGEDWMGLDEIRDSDWAKLNKSFWDKT